MACKGRCGKASAPRCIRVRHQAALTPHSKFAISTHLTPPSRPLNDTSHTPHTPHTPHSSCTPHTSMNAPAPAAEPARGALTALLSWTQGSGTGRSVACLLGDHGTCQRSGLPQVRARPCGDVVRAKDELLGHAAPHAHVQPRQHLPPRHAGGVILRQLRHHAQRKAYRTGMRYARLGRHGAVWERRAGGDYVGVGHMPKALQGAEAPKQAAAAEPMAWL